MRMFRQQPVNHTALTCRHCLQIDGDHMKVMAVFSTANVETNDQPLFLVNLCQGKGTVARESVVELGSAHKVREINLGFTPNIRIQNSL